MRTIGLDAVAGRRYDRAMQIRVLYFAVFREQIGREDDVVALPDGAQVRDAIAALAARHPPIARLRGKFRVAVNQDFSDDDRALADGDEIALIPPVAGGADLPADRDRPRHIELRSTPLSLDRCIAAVAGPGMGGIVSFTGMVRRQSHGATIDHLEYEAYGGMAIREMTRLCDEIEAELGGTRLAVEHRVGRLEVGEIAVVIAAAAPHRAEAFAACRAMIDRLKQRVPIWKKEVGDSGEEWIGLGP
jgi:molybdopterin synthase catalytic subunit